MAFFNTRYWPSASRLSIGHRYRKQAESLSFYYFIIFFSCVTFYNCLRFLFLFSCATGYILYVLGYFPRKSCQSLKNFIILTVKCMLFLLFLSLFSTLTHLTIYSTLSKLLGGNPAYMLFFCLQVYWLSSQLIPYAIIT